MSEGTQERSGSCLCGSVKISAKNASTHLGACHCSSCRKWGGGGPLLALECGADVQFEGEESIAIYESSPWADRGFCSRCGTSLFYRLRETAQYHVPVSLFDSNDNIVFTSQIFTEEKPAFYDFANSTENMTGAELFAKFAPPE